MTNTPQFHIHADYTALCEQLERTWYEEIPLTKALGVSIAGFDGTRLSVRADFESNINLHGTAFAGSLYAINALCGWSMVHLQLQMADLHGSIVLVEGKIRYALPVQGGILSACDFTDQQAGIAALGQGRKKGRFPTLCRIDQDGREAAVFEGAYAVLLG